MTLARSFAWFIIGALAGASATTLFGWTTERVSHSGRAPDAAPAIAGVSVSNAPSADRILLSSMARVAESASQLQDPDDLESRIAAIASSRRLASGRHFDLEVLLTRLVEMDPGRSVALVRELGLPPEWLVHVFREWATMEPDAALAGARELLPDPPSMYAVATTLLDVLGLDDEGLARVLAALPEVDENGLRIAMLERLAERDMRTALHGVAEMTDSGSRRAAVEAIAATAGEQDPIRALAYAGLLEDWNDRLYFQRPLMERWAEIEPDGFLAYLGTLSVDPWNVVNAESGLRAAAAADPERALAAIEHLPSTWRTATQYVVIETAAQQDPSAAIAFVQAMPAGEARNRLLHAVAYGYAMADPDAAISWARSLSAVNADVADAILTAIAATDLERAVDVALHEGLRASPRPPSWLTSDIHSELENPGALADRIVASGTGARASTLLHAVLSRWAADDVADTLTWLTSTDRLTLQTIPPVAREMGRQDLVGALHHAAALSENLRDPWIEEAVNAHAANDPYGAFAAIESLRGQPMHDELVRHVVSRMASLNPRSAAEYTLHATPSVQRRLAPRVALTWARSDPASAAQWAAGLHDPSIRSDALGAALFVWAQADRDAAAFWAQSLPTGEVRERAIARAGLGTAASMRGDVP